MFYLNKNLTLESTCSLNEAKVALMGVPFDSTSTYRVGSRNGPLEVRKELYELEKEESFFDIPFYDLGNVDVVHGNTSETLKRVEESVKYALSENPRLFLITIGGEHTVSYPVVKSLSEGKEKIHVLNLDAHMDLKDDYMGERWCHATVMRRISELDVTLSEIGVRSFLKDEKDYAVKKKINYSGINKNDFEKILKELKGRKVYLTLDFDAITPEVASGVSNPEPDGLMLKDVEFVFNSLFQSSMVIGADIVEVNPLYDKTSTTVIAGKLLQDLIIKAGKLK